MENGKTASPERWNWKRPLKTYCWLRPIKHSHWFVRKAVWRFLPVQPPSRHPVQNRVKLTEIQETFSITSLPVHGHVYLTFLHSVCPSRLGRWKTRHVNSRSIKVGSKQAVAADVMWPGEWAWPDPIPELCHSCAPPGGPHPAYLPGSHLDTFLHQVQDSPLLWSFFIIHLPPGKMGHSLLDTLRLSQHILLILYTSWYMYVSLHLSALILSAPLVLAMEPVKNRLPRYLWINNNSK